MPRGRKRNVTGMLASAGGAVLGGVGDAPPGLSSGAREKWGHLVPLLSRSCPLVATDADAIAQYCEAWALRCKALSELHADGNKLVHQTPNGALQINPLITIARQQEAVMMRLSERFGLDPASRQRLKLGAGGDGGESDEFGEFLKDKPDASD